MTFRNSNDQIHFFGSGALSLLLGLLAYRCLHFEWWIAYLIGFAGTNILGLIWEFLEDQVFVKWTDHEYWKNKPRWIFENLSGDWWDWEDIKLNLLGSTIIYPLIVGVKGWLSKSE